MITACMTECGELLYWYQVLGEVRVSAVKNDRGLASEL